jgi:hypothetical protein
MKRRILIVVGVLVGLLVIVDVAGRFVAEAATAKALKSSLDLSSQPKVSIGGVPFLTHLASNEFPSVTVRADQVDSGPITFQSVRADLHDVHVPVMDLAGGQRVQITAATGTGQAAVTANEITQALQRNGSGVTVEFDQGRVRVQIPGTAAFVTADVAIEGGQLVLRSPVLETLLPSVHITLPQVVPGVHYTSVRVGRDTAVLEFEVRNATFDVGG